jgi:hypothetical protein
LRQTSATDGKRRRVDTYPALAYHLLEIPIADAVAAVPADAEQDDLGQKPATRLNTDERLNETHGIFSTM